MNFSRKSSLKRHTLTVHQKIKINQILCKFCKKTMRKDNYLTHLKKKHQHEDKKKCEMCGVTFSTKNLLEQHHRKNHLNSGKI